MERSIIFSGPMVRAILEGEKTQTRRLKGLDKINRFPDRHASAYQDGGGSWVFWYPDSPGLAEKTKQLYPNGEGIPCPFGRPGDLLWVRESAYIAPVNFSYSGNLTDSEGRRRTVDYAATMSGDGVRCATDYGVRLTPSIHMPRWASRITLEIAGVRVERLNKITEEDALAEGVTPAIVGGDLDGLKYRAGFQSLWEQISGKKAPWASNPWVWVIEFRRVEEAK